MKVKGVRPQSTRVSKASTFFFSKQALAPCITENTESSTSALLVVHLGGAGTRNQLITVLPVVVIQVTPANVSTGSTAQRSDCQFQQSRGSRRRPTFNQNCKRLLQFWTEFAQTHTKHDSTFQVDFIRHQMLSASRSL
jgi:hypothetical protein